MADLLFSFILIVIVDSGADQKRDPGETAVLQAGLCFPCFQILRWECGRGEEGHFHPGIHREPVRPCSFLFLSLFPPLLGVDWCCFHAFAVFYFDLLVFFLFLVRVSIVMMRSIK